ncbi:MAG: SMP-30/gluconolactonase/LRE family protein, partial [Ignavibacterium sp.]|nr:SMP-30/gluconolactonase/LRE family protein [Ignavibacterium sp.]
MVRIVKVIVKRTKTQLDDIILKIIEKPLLGGIFLYGLMDSLLVLDAYIPKEVMDGLYGLYQLVMLLVCAYAGYRIFKDVLMYYGRKLAQKTESNLDDIMVPVIEKIGSGFTFTEGPIYLREGYLLFSDIPRNTIYKWTPDGKVTEFRKPSGYDGTDAPPGAFIGSNGLTLDREGRLVICEHGNRRVTR